MRTSRVGRDNIRVRCARLDPARGNRWRHPLLRLVSELLGYVSAIRRAPISPRDRWRCTKELVVWAGRPANPVRRPRQAVSIDLQIQAPGAASPATPQSREVRASQGRLTSIQREGKAQ